LILHEDKNLSLPRRERQSKTLITQNQKLTEEIRQNHIKLSVSIKT
tara:strand:- start:178 stop:315 length:138 start_codon:yes stop_codon:yes gene_type:complete